jgi:hypothetical protein
LDPLKSSRDALELAAALHEMTSAAAEVIFRRSQVILSGRMSPPDALAMVLEKATVFGEASQLATVAAARGGDPFSIARAALGPYGLKTRANVERLRL